MRYDDDRNLQFLRQSFESRGYFRDFQLAIVLRAAGSGPKQLQIINDHHAHVLLRFEPARLRPQFENGESRTVVDENFRFREFRRRCGQTRKVALSQKSVAHFLQIHARPRAQQTLHQLLAAHFQAEHADWKFFINRHVFCNVHGQRGLTHAGSRGNYDHFRSVQTAGHPVEFDKARGDSSDAAFALVKFLDRLDGFHDLVLHGKHLALEAVFAHREDFLFHFVEEIVHVILLFVSAADALGGGGNDFPQNVFVANYLEIILHVRCSRDERKEVRDQRRAAYAVEQIPVAQHLCKCDQIDCLTRVPKIDKDAVNRAVRGDVEVFLINFLDAFRDGLARGDEH